ncbi:MAG: hypothetical protein ABI539_14080, partial [Acidobacteriota bacterium]
MKIIALFGLLRESLEEMSVKILFFGAAAESAGTRSFELERPVTSAGEVFDQMIEQFPNLSRLRLLISVNQAYADRSTGAA